ncbi:MAG: hypothetical protein IT366_10165 [Candidatus Hydrogenedentes bacterium]|nr:hypothetical protein [Candidatus Hydrogenedentota bacterium]
MPKPPGLSPGQKAMVGFAIVATLLITLASIFLLTWMNKATEDTSLQFDVLGDAKKRQAARRAAYNEAIAKLPANEFPMGWTTERALKACGKEDHYLVYTVGEVLYAGGDRFGPLDLPYLAQMLDVDTSESALVVGIHPASNAPDAIEQNLRQFLLESSEIANLCKAVRNGIYYIDIDPTVSTWKHMLDENAVAERETVATLLELRALLEARWGAPQSAVEAYLDATQFAALLGNDPYLSYHWLRYSVERRADIALWELVDKHALDAEAVDRIAQSLARRADTTRLKALIIEDVVLEAPRSLAASDMSNPLTGKMVEMMGLYDPAKARKAGEELAAYMDRPYPELAEFAYNVSEEESEHAEHLGEVVYEAQYARSAQLRSAFTAEAFRIALALKKYKAQTGAYPQLLAQLTPEYLDSIPNEPVTDAPIKYMPWNGGFFLLAQGDTDEYEDVSYYEDDSSEFGDGYTDETLWHAES